jgi:microcystin-dependent protein/cytoskeletal protein CcmA (bactofilin family)
MSINRTKSRQINNSVLLQNRLTNFTNPPMRTGDLYVEKNETIGGDLDISGNLTIGRDLRVHNYYATGNIYIDQNGSFLGNLDVSGNITVRRDLRANGNIHIDKNGSFRGELDVSGNLTVQNDSRIIGDLQVDQNGLIRGELDVSGNLTVQNDSRATSFYATGNYYLDNYVLIPPGTVIQSAAVNEPNGWFDCDGRLLNRLVYADLFAAIGYAYGGADLSFNIPDTRGRVAIGLGTGSGLTGRILGSAGGAETHTLSLEEIPSHSHSLTRRRNPDDDAFDTNDAHQDESSAATTDREDMGLFNTYNTGGVFGGGTASHNNMQPFITLRSLIKY